MTTQTPLVPRGTVADDEREEQHMAQPTTGTGSSTARNGRTVTFTTPYDRDGITVITAAATREHTAAVTVTPGGSPECSRLDAGLSGGRPAGAYVVEGGRVRWRPALDVTRLLVTAELVVGAVLVARRLAARPAGARSHVTMGPGGWVSMKGGAMAVRPARRAWLALPRLGGARRGPARPRGAGLPKRPVWARLLSATALQTLLRA